jgi:hypothetical protein
MPTLLFMCMTLGGIWVWLGVIREGDPLPVLTATLVTETHYLWTRVFPQFSLKQLRNEDHHFGFLLPFVTLGTGNLSPTPAPLLLL